MQSKKIKIEISNEAKLPSKWGDFLITSFREYAHTELYKNGVYKNIINDDLGENLVLEHLCAKTPKIGENPLVRVHSECLTGDVFGSLKCDCGPELASALTQMSKDPQGGLLIYLRQEGRGIGLWNKINAYALQDRGLDTVQANEELGFKAEMRSFAVVSEILAHYKIKKFRLLTNNPKKVEQIAALGDFEIQRVAIIEGHNPHNAEYLAIKRDKMGHIL